MKTKRITFSVAILVIGYFLVVGFNNSVQEKWTSPDSANKIINPIKGDAASTSFGKKSYKVLCLVCHGIKGKGDGIGSTGLTPKPTDLTSVVFQSQTDGAIFWKIAEGRAPMASYKTAIPEIKRWEIINYIRTLKK